MYVCVCMHVQTCMYVYKCVCMYRIALNKSLPLRFEYEVHIVKSGLFKCSGSTIYTGKEINAWCYYSRKYDVCVHVLYATVYHTTGLCSQWRRPIHC